ncbi:hypothetical protein CCH79_00015402 [Gambusia affinis]|uniref:TIL domain-containing protein n=1 Tax=Gambusia affinis TaxID=33528 RepID=A0A315VHU8_GAMAF|nr:hypothetical protein CCH79_00015402 [Gambusia affinis]
MSSIFSLSCHSHLIKFTAPVACQWSSWSPWSPCSASCGTGQQSSTRRVLQPSLYGGAPCDGLNIRSTACAAPDCGECLKHRRFIQKWNSWGGFTSPPFASLSPCAACPSGERWRRSRPEEEEAPPCERSCGDIYSTPPASCSRLAGGCVCLEGLYRNPEGTCVIPALCPCHDQGVLREVGFISLVEQLILSL